MFGLLLILIQPADSGPTGAPGHDELRVDTTHSGSTVVFQRFGTTIHTLGYAHIHVKLDLQTVLDRIEDALQLVDKALMRPQDDVAALLIHRQTLLDCRHSISNLLHLNRNPYTARDKRFLAEILGIANTFLGIFNTYQLGALSAQVNGLAATQEAIIHSVADTQIATKANSEAINYLGEAMNATINGLVKTDQWVRTISNIGAVVTALVYQTSKIHLIMSDVLQGRLNPTVIVEGEMTDILYNLHKMTSAHGFRLLVKNAAEGLQCATSFVSTEAGYDLFLHIPMATAEDSLDLYKLLPIPSQISPDSMMTFEPTKTIIAISRDDSKFKTMHQSQLSECTQAGTIYLCENENVVRRINRGHDKGINGDGTSEEDMCLYYLFTQDTEKAAAICPIHLRKPTDTAVQIGPTEFLFHNQVDQQASIVCEGLPTERVNVAQPTRRKLAPGCQVITDHYYAVASSDVEDNAPRMTVEYVWPVPIQTLLADVDVKHFEALREQQNRLQPVPTLLTGVREMVEEARQRASQAALFSWGQIIAITVACLIVCVIIGGCLWKKYAARRALAVAQRRAGMDSGFTAFAQNRQNNAETRRNNYQTASRENQYSAPPTYNPTYEAEDPEQNPSTNWLTGK